MTGRTDAPAPVLRVEWPTPRVALATLSRPDAMNTLSLELIAAIGEALGQARAARARALVFTGAGRAFCAGADLTLLSDAGSPVMRSAFAFRDAYVEPLAKLFDAFEEAPFPIVAAINGFALGGGCELALSCDVRVMSRTAKLGLPEVHVGAIPAAGGVQKLIRHVGRSKALEWILTGAHVDAQQALAHGLVAEVTEPGDVVARALAFAARFERGGPDAIAQAKAAVYLAEDADLRSARRFGVEAITSLVGRPEWTEGMAAFVAKRPPRFDDAP